MGILFISRYNCSNTSINSLLFVAGESLKLIIRNFFKLGDTRLYKSIFNKQKSWRFNRTKWVLIPDTYIIIYNIIYLFNSNI